jgi:hypothetical protein
MGFCRRNFRKKNIYAILDLTRSNRENATSKQEWNVQSHFSALTIDLQSLVAASINHKIPAAGPKVAFFSQLFPV